MHIAKRPSLPVSQLEADFPNKPAPYSSALTVTNHRWGRFHGSLRYLTLLNYTTPIKNIGHPYKTDKTVLKNTDAALTQAVA
jgi:hypothetical protein